MDITLKPLDDNDIDLIQHWMEKEHIQKWYHEPDEWIHEMRQRNGEFSFLRHYMLLEDEVLFGFCQYYDCFYAQEEWYSVEMAGQIYSIDYLIGEEAYLRKGYGKAIVKALVNKIKAESPEAKIIVQPEEENLPSCKALLASGFIFDDEKRYYILV